MLISRKIVALARVLKAPWGEIPPAYSAIEPKDKCLFMDCRDICFAVHRRHQESIGRNFAENRSFTGDSELDLRCAYFDTGYRKTFMIFSVFLIKVRRIACTMHFPKIHYFCHCVLNIGVPKNNGLRSNPLNLIRVMPAKGRV